MDNSFFTKIQTISKVGSFYSVLSFLQEKEQCGEIVLYAGTYPFDMAMEKFGTYDRASFYIYISTTRTGYHIYQNRMGCGVEKDDKLFKITHRRLYCKKFLSNCFWGEKDYRCGEFFNKRK